MGIVPAAYLLGQGGSDTITMNLPRRLLPDVNARVIEINKRLLCSTKQFVALEKQRLNKLQEKSLLQNSPGNHLFKIDSYTSFLSDMQGGRNASPKIITGEYLPYIDSIHNLLHFLHSTSTLSPQIQQLLSVTINNCDNLESNLQTADNIRELFKTQQDQIRQFLLQQGKLTPQLAERLQNINKEVYYYSTRLKGYRETLNNPDRLIKQAIRLLSQLPSFHSYLLQHSQLAGLIGLPVDYGTQAALAGLQTKDQVNELIQGQLGAGGAEAASTLQANLQSAQAGLDSYKDKLNKLGAAGGDLDLPNFKPNDQKTKTFWKRLEYGANFQTTRNNTYYPTVADLGLSVGYKLGHGNVVGIGASYKVGLGSGWNHISFSSQGVGLRSFIDIKLKGSLLASGGYECNYTAPFSSFQQLKQLNNWSRSGLIGVSKAISMKSRFFKKTKLSLLWDFLSYQQIPRTQPLLFRIGYAF